MAILTILDQDGLGQLNVAYWDTSFAPFTVDGVLGTYAWTVAQHTNIHAVFGTGLALVLPEPTGTVTGWRLYAPDKQTVLMEITGANVSFATFSNGDDRGAPSLLSGNDTLTGTSFIDILEGHDGDDAISAGAGDDTAFGGEGDDQITGAKGADRLEGDAGDDDIDGGEGGDIVWGGAGDDVIEGSTGNDSAYYSGAWAEYRVTKVGTSYVVEDLRSGSPDGTDRLSQVETLVFSNGSVGSAAALRKAPVATAVTPGTAIVKNAYAFDSSIHFSDANTAMGDVITYAASGLPSWLKIDAATGILSGTPRLSDVGNGSVTIIATDIHGLTGRTTLKLSVENVVIGTEKRETLNGSTTPDKISGLGGKDKLLGKAGKDILDGGDGNDTLVGGAQGDKLIGGLGKDTASYEDATDFVIASLDGRFKKDVDRENTDATGDSYASIENLTGSDHDDGLAGNKADNVLKGGKGDDVLIGGRGADTLVGNSGADQYGYLAIGDSTVAAEGRDIITGFASGQDIIEISYIDAKAGSKKNHKFSFIGRDEFSNTKGELRFEKAGKKTFVYGDVTGDGIADLAIELTGKIDLQKADFVL